MSDKLHQMEKTFIISNYMDYFRPEPEHPVNVRDEATNTAGTHWLVESKLWARNDESDDNFPNVQKVIRHAVTTSNASETRGNIV